MSEQGESSEFNNRESKEKQTGDDSFLKRLDSVSENGLFFNGIYLPPEIVMLILTHLDGKDLLKSSLVCRKWLNMIRSNTFWYTKFRRQFKRKPKKLPWYVYFAHFYHEFFDRNFLKNGNGEEKFKHWKIIDNHGDKMRVEDTPQGASALPEDVDDFNGHLSCFATSYSDCRKIQAIRLPPLCGYILNEHKPHIYVSEWMAGRFDCGCIYRLVCRLYGNNYRKFPRTYSAEQSNPPLKIQEATSRVEQWEGSEWSKIEMVLDDYPNDVRVIVFEHFGRDTQFWAGHYGPKMAGGVMKILFDSIKELDTQEDEQD